MKPDSIGSSTVQNRTEQKLLRQVNKISNKSPKFKIRPSRSRWVFFRETVQIGPFSGFKGTEMLLTDISVVRAAHIVLASASMTRANIINDVIRANARIVPVGLPETIDISGYAPLQLVEELSKQKAIRGFAICVPAFAAKHAQPPSLIIGAETAVVLDGKVLDKPKSTDDARRMLRALSDAGTHAVLTGVSLAYGDDKPGAYAMHTFTEVTSVAFRKLTDDEIEEYVATGEPMASKGAYSIKGFGSSIVTGITGDYQNILGFPVARFIQEVDTGRLASWVAAAALKDGLPVGAPKAKGDTLVSAIECQDADECGMPSD